MVTSTDVANEALNLMGNNAPPVTGVAPNFDNSTAGQALAKLYAPAVATVARQWGWDMARNTVALAPSGNTPQFWLYEYLYPPNGIEIWQLVPQTITDVNNPLPVNWQVANAQVGGNQTKVIQTNLPTAYAVYNNNPNENTWDPLFRESVVRLLASELAMALAGKPDTAMNLAESGTMFQSLGEGRPD